MLILSEFDLRYVYVKGKDNHVADALSRLRCEYPNGAANEPKAVDNGPATGSEWPVFAPMNLRPRLGRKAVTTRKRKALDAGQSPTASQDDDFVWEDSASVDGSDLEPSDSEMEDAAVIYDQERVSNGSWRARQQADPKWGAVLKWLEDGKEPVDLEDRAMVATRGSEFSLRDGVLMHLVPAKQGGKTCLVPRVVVPKMVVAETVLTYHGDALQGAHQGWARNLGQAPTILLVATDGHRCQGVGGWLPSLSAGWTGNSEKSQVDIHCSTTNAVGAGRYGFGGTESDR